MPRSFLVKKHHSSKKPNYGKLKSKAQEAPCNTHEDPLLHNNTPPYHHCQAPIPPLQQAEKPVSSSPCPLSLRRDRLYLPSPPNTSTSSFFGHYSRACRRNPAEACRLNETCTKMNLEIKCVAARRRESLLPPSLPLVALFPTILSASGSQESFECLDFHNEHFSFLGLAKPKQLQSEWSSKKYFSCKYCEKEYVSLGALKMHIRTHTLPCVCTLCGKAFSRPWLLQGHIRTHTGEKPFSCLHCSRAFADRSNLRAHLQTHSEMKKYKCACCFKTFSRISLLAKHQEAGCSLS